MNKTALVIGAGQSLGAYLAWDLVNSGYKVIVADLNEDNARDVSLKIGDASVSTYAKVDATDETSVMNMISNLTEDFNKIDLLVYNAGIAKSHKITDFSIDDFEANINVNLVGYFNCVKHVAINMIKHNIKGRIIQINSKSGKVGSKHNAGYSSAKFGAVGLTQSVALDLAEHNITVNSLMLGNLLDSDMFESLLPQYAIKLNVPEEDVKQIYIDKVPLKRGCNFEDVAAVLKFYASDEASYCTGQSINITGGQVMF